MKTELEITEMALALCDMRKDDDKPPGLPQCATARVEGMMLALNWALEEDLPGKYPAWFEKVRAVAAARRDRLSDRDSLCE